MKKTIKYSILGVIAGAMLASCETDPETGLVRLTHYATFDLTGGEIYSVPIGGSYSEPGVVCMEGTEDITKSRPPSTTSLAKWSIPSRPMKLRSTM